MREIGSEFWQQNEPVRAESTNTGVYVLSGRTALRFIIDDIHKSKRVRKALLPSYCCDSMIFPFVQSGINVEFYQVNDKGMEYPYDNDADIVFLIDYFGFVNAENSHIAQYEKQAGKVVIYDSTHKIDGNPNVEAYADYSFCSYRKWICCNYAKAVKHNGAFEEYSAFKWHNRYLDLRNEAAQEKSAYIAGTLNDKQSYLSKFSAAEELLDEDYIGYAGVPVEFDLHRLISKRRENATYLMKELKGISQIKLWREELQYEDTPLFVPILVDPEVRMDLRRYLISHQIYCPIHWPKSAYHGKCNELYDSELSLVCDQRYDVADMEYMIGKIKEFFVG